MKFRSVLAGAAALALSGTLALAVGLWPGFPTVPSGAEVGGTAQTGSATCNGTNQGTCTNGGMTGSEVYPADTLQPAGAVPETVLLQMGQQPYFVAAVTATAFSVTIPNHSPNFIVDTSACGSGVCATGTIIMPTAPPDGFVQNIITSGTSGGTITALTLTASAGQTLLNIPTAITVSLTAPYGVAYIWSAQTSKWYRLR